MKTISKHLKAVVVLLLALVMLCSVSFTAIAAVTDGESQQTLQTKSTVLPDNTGEGENITGWLDITYGKDGVTLTLTPDIAEIKGITKNELTSLVSTLVEAFKTVVISDIKDDFIAGGESITSADFVDKAMDLYLDEVGYASAMDFFKDLVDPLFADVVREDFIDYACDLLGTSIKLGVVDPDDLPTGEKLGEKITQYVEDTVNDYIDEYIDGNITDLIDIVFDEHGDVFIDKYFDEYLDVFVDKYFDEYLGKFIDTYFETYLGDFIDTYFDKYLGDFIDTYFDKYFADFIDSNLSAFVDKYLDEKLVSFVDTYFDKYLADFIDTYFDKYLGDFIDTYFEDNLDSFIDTYFDENLDTITGKYLDELFGASATYNGEVEEMLRDKMQLSVAEYIKDHVFNYLDNNVGTDEVDKIIEKYIKKKVHEELVGSTADPGLIDEYIDGTMTSSDPLYDFITDRLQSYIEDHFLNDGGYEDYVAEYIAYVKNGGTGDAIYDEVTNDIDNSIGIWVAEVIEFKKNGTPVSSTNRIVDVLSSYTATALETAWSTDEAAIRAEIWAELLADDTLLESVVTDDLESFWDNHKDDHGFIKEYAGNLWSGASHDELLAEIEEMILDSNTCKHTIIDSLFVDDLGNLKVDFTIDHLKEMLVGLDAGEQALLRAEIEAAFETAVDGAVTELKAVIADSTLADPNGYRAMVDAVVAEAKAIVLDETLADPNGYRAMIEDVKADVKAVMTDDTLADPNGYRDIINDVIDEVKAVIADDTLADPNGYRDIVDDVVDEIKAVIADDTLPDPNGYRDVVDDVIDEVKAVMADATLADPNGYRAMINDVKAEIKAVMADATLADPNGYRDVINDVIDEVKAVIADDTLADPNGYRDIVNDVVDEVKAVIADDTLADPNGYRDIVNDVVDEIKAVMADDTLADPNGYRDIITDFVDELKALMSDDTLPDPNGYRDIITDLIDEIKALIVDKNAPDPNGYRPVISDFIDDYCVDKFGLTYEELLDEIDIFKSQFIVSYDDTLKNTGEFSPKDILLMIKSVKMGEHGGALYEIYGDETTGTTQFFVANLVELFNTLPTIDELALMSAEEMNLVYDFYVNTQYGDCDFNIALVASEEAYDYIHRAAGVVADHVDYSFDLTNGLFADVEMPAIFTAAVLKACESGRIPEDLKDKVFTVISKNPDEAYTFFTELEYADIITLLEKIDFEDILNKDQIAKFVNLVDPYITQVDLDTLTNEELIAKLEQYAGHFNTLKNYVARIYSKVPAALKTKDIFDLYDGNGVFSIDADANNINVADSLYKLVSRFNEDLALALSTALDIKTLDIAADVTVSFTDIYSVEFYQPGETESYRRGFLPAGADLSAFADVTEINGEPVLAWVEFTTTRALGTVGKVLTEMPEGDVKIMALVKESVTSPDDVAAEADGTVYDLTAGVSANIDLASIVGVQVAYQWYKDGAAISGALADTYPVSLPTDSGEYYCVITITADIDGETTVLAEYTTDTATVQIDERIVIDVDLDDIKLLPAEIIYNGSLQTVTLSAYDGTYILMTIIDGASGTNAGTYTAQVKIEVLDEYKHHTYIRINGVECQVYDQHFIDWEIKRAKVEVTDNGLIGDVAETYDGTEKEVSFDVTHAAPDGVLVITTSGNKATNAGSYTAELEIALDLAVAANYELWVNGVLYDTTPYTASAAWEIGRAKVEVTDNGLIGDVAETYDGTEKGVSFDVTHAAPDGVLVITTAGNKATNAGSYTAELEIALDPTVAANYELWVNGVLYDTTPYTASAAWEIGRQRTDVTISGLVNADDLVYNANDQTVTFDSVYGTAVEYTVTGNVQKNAGTYEAKASFKLTDNNYVLYVNGAEDADGIFEFTATWSIARFTIVNEGFITKETEYNEEEQVFLLDFVLPDADALEVVYKNNKATNAGTYTMEAIYNIAAAHANNYVIVDEFGNELAQPVTLVCVWTITKRVIETGDFLDALVQNEFVYDGTEKSATLKNLGILNDFAIDLFTSDKGTNVGTYRAILIITLEDTDNNVFVDDDGNHITSKHYELPWSITPKAVNAGDLDVSLEVSDFVFDGQSHSVELKDLPYYIIAELSGDVVMTEKGTYTVTATIRADGNHMLIDATGAVVSELTVPLTWTISSEKVYVEIGNLVNSTGLIYNGTVQSVSFDKLVYDPALVNVTITGLSATGAGDYTVTVNVSLKNPDNYELVILGETTHTWSIAKKTVVVEIGTLTNATGLVYNGAVQSVSFDKLSYDADLVKVTVSGLSAINAGSNYTAFVNVELLDTANYELKVIGAQSQSWSIAPARIDATIGQLLNATGLVYNGSSYLVSFDNVKYDPKLVNFELVGNKQTGAGSYEAKAVFTLKDTLNYDLYVNGVYAGDSYEQTAKWSIARKSVTVEIGNLVNADGLVYNGKLQSVTFDKIVYDPALVTMTVEGNSATAAGEYEAKVVFELLDSANYQLNVIGNTTGHTWSIAKARADVAFDALANASGLVYNAATQTVNFANVNYPRDLVTYTVTGNSAIDAGDYTAAIKFVVNDSDNYDLFVNGVLAEGGEYEFTEDWSIAKADIYAEFDVTFDNDYDFTYDGEEKNVSFTVNKLWFDSALSNIVSVEYVGTSATNADEYTAYARFVLAEEYRNNYALYINGDLCAEGVYTVSADWEIKPVKVSYKDLINGDLVLEYNGKRQSVKFDLGEYADFINVTYSGNAAEDIGVYTLTATFSVKDEYIGNYVLVDEDGNISDTMVYTADWEIAKINVTLDSVSFEDLTVDCDGTKKSITIIGTLPAGVSVVYSNHEHVKVGVYKATAVITVDDPELYTIDGQTSVTLEAVLTIVAAPRTFNVTDSTGKVIAEVTAHDGMVADGVDLSTVDISFAYDTCEFAEHFDVKYGGKVAKIYLAYDLNFVDKNGDRCTIDDTFTVRIALPDSIKNNPNLILLYINDEGVAEQELAYTIDNGYITFNTDHFSAYAVAEAVDAPVTDESSFPWWIILIIVGGIIIIVVVIIIIKKKRSGPSDPTEPTEELPEDGAETEEPEEESLPEEEAPIAELPPLDEAFAEEAPVEEPAVEETVAEEAPVEEPAVEEAVAEEAPVEEPAVEEAVAEEAPAEEPAVEEAVAEEAPVEEPVVEEAVAEEAPVEEPVVEEAVAEEAPAEDPVVEEAVAEEAPVAEKSAEESGEVIIAIAPETKGDEDESIGQRIINGEVVLVSYRSSYMSRLIQADSEIQDYYTVIKNTLLSYEGVKARTSWNFESFNKGRVQCAKINLKGRSLLVYIGLDPNEYNINKYHFVDVSDKPKFEKVPMLMKVKSDRGLKYVLELIEEMMNKNQIPQGPMPTDDYHMPYETTEALVKRDLVKVILPPGVTLDENANIGRLDVGEMLDNANGEKTEIHVDAEHADELLTDEEAEASIEMIERTESEPRDGKLAEVNLDTICDNFDDGETVDLNALQEKRIVSKSAGRIKVIARGIMTKRLIIIADKFSLQAVKMITLAGGVAEQYK